MSTYHVTELELQAYLDGELSQQRRADVEAYLVQNPEAAAALVQLKNLNNSLHEHYDAVLDEPIPESITAQLAAFQQPEQSVKSRTSWHHHQPQSYQHDSLQKNHYPRSVAASWLLLGCLLGTVLGSVLTMNRTAVTEFPSHPLSGEVAPDTEKMDSLHNDLIQPATFAHVIFTPERQHAVEIEGNQQQQLSAWLSSRMHWPIKIPDLQAQGLTLVGGRLLPSTNRMAAQFMYETEDGQRMTLYVRRINAENNSVQFHFEEKNGLSVFYWLSSPLGYALTGQMDRSSLMKAVEAIHAQLI